MSKNILITAGGTVEPIDRVRSITNKGTGRLGSLVADSLADNDEVGKIFYIHAVNSFLPATNKSVNISIESTDDLEREVKRLCAEEKIDAVVHSMAVSDYSVRAVLPIEDIAGKNLSSEELIELFDCCNIQKAHNKLPSSLKSPLILLEQTPKILPMFRKLLPEAMIIGFKLLDNVSHEELIDTAHRLLISNGCDYILANDYVSVESGRHEGFLIDREKTEKRSIGKQRIADMIAKAIINGGTV